MRVTRTTILAGGAALLVAGTAATAADKLHTLQVALPDGSIAQIEYAGDTAPKLSVEPVEARRVVMLDPFAQLDAMAAAMQAQQAAMLEQMAALQQAAASSQASTTSVPAGVHYSYYSSTTDANGCTETVQYSSDGGAAEPTVTRASAGNCDAAKEPGPVPASAAPAAPRPLDDRDI